MTKRSEKMRESAPLSLGQDAENKAQLAALRDVRAAGAVELWPIDRLVPHPDNPRTVRRDSPKFRELVESIRANGIYEPLTVRELQDGKEEWRLALGIPFGEVLSGHRRLAAAREVGLTHVPVRSLGRITDAAAFDIVAMGNLHEDLTPLEEGKRAAVWLDKYKEDVQAVASKLGRTPSWVVQHAQIARGLSADWQKEIAEATDHEERPTWRAWTAGHLAVIARLPASLQAHYLEKTRKDYRFNHWPGATVARIEEDVKLDLLYLAKAPFNATLTCGECVNRTDRQPLLWGEAVEAATGDKARCLDKKCWDGQCRTAAKLAFKAKVRAACDAVCKKPEPSRQDVELVRQLEGALPLSLVEEPQDCYKRDAYRKEQSALKKTFPKLVTADRVTVVTEKTQGAVPAIVVAGKGKGSLKWVKIVEKKESGSGGRSRDNYNSAASQARWQKEEARRKLWETACREAWGRIAKAGPLSDEKVLVCSVYANVGPHFRTDESKVSKKMEAAYAADPSLESVVRTYVSLCRDAWKIHVKGQQKYCWSDNDREVLNLVGPFFGVDVETIHQDLAVEKSAESEKGQKGADVCPVEAGTGECVSDGDCTQCPRGQERAKPKAKAGRKKKNAAAEAPAANGLPDGDLPEDEEEHFEE